MNDAEARAEPFGDDTPREVVQHHQTVGQFHRPQGPNRVDIEIVIDVGAAQLQDDRPSGVLRLEALDRICAAPRMDGHHRVGRFAVIVGGNPRPVAEVAQDARPAGGGDAVAGA
jgi:hypothetical protein